MISYHVCLVMSIWNFIFFGWVKVLYSVISQSPVVIWCVSCWWSMLLSADDERERTSETWIQLCVSVKGLSCCVDCLWEQEWCCDGTLSSINIHSVSALSHPPTLWLMTGIFPPHRHGSPSPVPSPNSSRLLTMTNRLLFLLLENIPYVLRLTHMASIYLQCGSFPTSPWQGG